MRGKEKCKALKEIRKQIAEKNDIEFAVSECTHKGDCKGTCPKCEAELRYLERQLELKKTLGKAVAVVGISAGVCTTMTACNPIDIMQSILSDAGNEELAGDVTQIPETGAMPAPEEDPESTPLPTDDVLDGDIASPEEVLMGEMPVDEEN